MRATAVLLISCPCAIGIAAPLAESHLISGLVRAGAIVRNRGCLAFLGRETVFVCDKTGTLTEGKFSVLEGLEKLTARQLSILKGLARQSTHAMSRGISEAIAGEGTSLTDIQEFAGKGLCGYLQENCYFLGSPEFMRVQNIGGCLSSASVLSPGIVSTVFFAENRQCLAVLQLRDRLREGARDMVQSMASKKRILLSGDSHAAVEAVAKECGFDAWHAVCHPLQKKEYLDGLRQKGEIVGMLGDGINDAPALTRAHVGISVVSATDMSIQVSDILLTTHSLSVVPVMASLANKARRIIVQNLFWAFFYNVVGIGLALCGYLSPIFAAFAMVASSLMVLFNARRLTYDKLN